jgi:predicted hydrolase (HD superfamily)
MGLREVLYFSGFQGVTETYRKTGEEIPTMKSLDKKGNEAQGDDSEDSEKAEGEGTIHFVEKEKTEEEKAGEKETAAKKAEARKAAEEDDSPVPVPPTPSIPVGEKLDAGISPEDALNLVRKYNEDPFHLEHAEMVGKLMRYYAGKYDAENADFWQVVGMLHDLDWEKWQDPRTHTVKTAELLLEQGVSPMVAHAIQTHNHDCNRNLPSPEHQMEKVLWAIDELSGLIGAAIRMYPSRSSADLNLKSLKKKFKDKRFAAGCDREYIKKGAELNGMELDDLFSSMIEAVKSIDGTL